VLFLKTHSPEPGKKKEGGNAFPPSIFLGVKMGGFWGCKVIENPYVNP
jgi:hypothetical protein